MNNLPEDLAELKKVADQIDAEITADLSRIAATVGDRLTCHAKCQGCWNCDIKLFTKRTQ
jgi:hypothetical protein